MMRLQNTVLEISAKAFHDDTEKTMRMVARKLFRQWSRLAGCAETVSVQLWSSGGSEILDYSGDPEQTFEIVEIYHVPIYA